MKGEKQIGATSSKEQSAYRASLEQALEVFRSLTFLSDNLQQVATECVRSLKNGHKLLACGNGGSACEAQHLVGELVGRYRSDRVPLPGLAMTADACLLTCIGNDYRFEDIFARQVEAFGLPGDVLIAFTTSGQSANVLRALEAARKRQVTSIAFLGGSGGAAASLANYALIVPHTDTARIQEGHQFLMHSLMDVIEAEFTQG
jgi:D-sedoheptulose 7-phosphate isomerase